MGSDIFSYTINTYPWFYSWSVFRCWNSNHLVCCVQINKFKKLPRARRKLQNWIIGFKTFAHFTLWDCYQNLLFQRRKLLNESRCNIYNYKYFAASRARNISEWGFIISQHLLNGGEIISHMGVSLKWVKSKKRRKYSRDCGWPRRPWPNAGRKKQKKQPKNQFFFVKKYNLPPFFFAYISWRTQAAWAKIPKGY